MGDLPQLFECADPLCSRLSPQRGLCRDCRETAQRRALRPQISNPLSGAEDRGIPLKGEACRQQKPLVRQKF